MVLGHDPSYQLEYGIILVLDKYTPCTKVLSDGMYRPEIPPKSIIFPNFCALPHCDFPFTSDPMD